jgi:hypothetical protein
MGTVEDFLPEKLIIGVLSSLPDGFDQVEPVLRDSFGEADYRSSDIPFTFTSYYDGEMGTPILRKFYSFTDPLDPARLADIKSTTNRLEERWAGDGLRRVNLDPGLLGMGRLVLASTKGPGHRIALSNGIYAEVTLVFRAKDFQPLPWTYPDFRSLEYRRIFREIRDMYHGQLRSLGFDRRLEGK